MKKIIGKANLFYIALAVFIGGAVTSEIVHYEISREYFSDDSETIKTIDQSFKKSVAELAARLCEIGATGFLFLNLLNGKGFKQANKYFLNFFPKSVSGLAICFAADIAGSCLELYFFKNWLASFWSAAVNTTNAFYCYVAPALLLAGAGVLAVGWAAFASGLTAKLILIKNRVIANIFNNVTALNDEKLLSNYQFAQIFFIISSALIAGLIVAVSMETKILAVILALSLLWPLAEFWVHYCRVVGAYARLTYYIKEKEPGRQKFDNSPLVKDSIERLNKLKNLN